MIKNDKITLRAPELTDVEILYKWENDKDIRYLGNIRVPVSRFLLEQYILNAGEDIYDARQLRLMAECTGTQRVIGHIDLFEFDPHHMRAGIGIMIDNEARNKGYASEMLSLIIDYCRNELNLHQLFCNITADNEISRQLFEKFGFENCGVKKEWIRKGDLWLDENIYQLLLEKRT